MKERGSRPPQPDEGDGGGGICIPTTRSAAMAARVPVLGVLKPDREGVEDNQ
uniref:Uncharacterized protein n=1 Tax=Helianthus annuus TaxID=4232 RepID=A0A251SXL5_HELAN